jgi:hypothetical protein
VLPNGLNGQVFGQGDGKRDQCNERCAQKIVMQPDRDGRFSLIKRHQLRRKAMKHALIGAVAVSALLGVAAQATPLPDPANSTGARESATLQKVDWDDWHDGYWRHRRYWGGPHWRHRYWRHRYYWDR